MLGASRIPGKMAFFLSSILLFSMGVQTEVEGGIANRFMGIFGLGVGIGDVGLEPVRQHAICQSAVSEEPFVDEADSTIFYRCVTVWDETEDDYVVYLVPSKCPNGGYFSNVDGVCRLDY